MIGSSKASRWKRLDNAAKIFPSNSNKRDTKVFRFACELQEAVQQETLQCALEETLKLFPLYRSVFHISACVIRLFIDFIVFPARQAHHTKAEFGL